MVHGDDLVGTVIGPYRVLALIGRGGMGSVYRAVHETIGKPVALKVLHPELAADPAVLERFLGEARAVNAIGHQNIVDIFDVSEVSPGQPVYLVMQLLDGVTLRDAIHLQGRFPPERAVDIALQIAHALQATHRVGIVHRDLKPENVFLANRSGRADFVVLMDFGIAKLGDRASFKTRTGAMLGTPHYMSPEQTESRDVDARTDVYALGVMLYEMLGGQRPFDGDSVTGILKQIWMHTPTPLDELRPGLPPGLGAAVMRAFGREPKERFATMEALGQALSSAVPLEHPPTGHSPPFGIGAGSLESIQTGPTIEATPTRMSAQRPFATSEAGPSSSRPRWIRLAPLLVGLAALATGVAFFVLSRGPDQRQPPPGAEGSPPARPTVPAAHTPAAVAEKTTVPPANLGDGGAAPSPAAPRMKKTPVRRARSRPSRRAAAPAGSHDRGVPSTLVPFDPKVLKAFLLRRDGRAYARCFYDPKRFYSATVRFEIDPRGVVKRWSFQRVEALDITYESSLSKCLRPLLQKARFPRTRKGGRILLRFGTGKLAPAPIHLGAPPLREDTMADRVLRTGRTGIASCVRPTRDFEWLTILVEVDADGRVRDVALRGTVGKDAKPLFACVRPKILRLRLSRTRAGGRFHVQIKRRDFVAADE